LFEGFTDRARRVLVLAQEEARQLNHSFIGTEHILLGLIHEGDGVAAKAIDSFGITLREARERVEEAIGSAGQTPSGTPPFTPRAKKVLELSLKEALQLGYSYIGAEHMLLGLVREGDGIGAQVLVSLGANLGQIRQRVLQMMQGFKYQGWEDVGAQHQRDHLFGSGDKDALLRKLLWNSKMIRRPKNAAERSIWDALTDRFRSGSEEVVRLVSFHGEAPRDVAGHRTEPWDQDPAPEADDGDR
jgi:ATP-dependent Clp protease ATP-binding subunit ClpC